LRLPALKERPAAADPQLVERARREGPITLYASMVAKPTRWRKPNPNPDPKE